MVIFKDYIKSLLPDYIVQHDSYKDVNGKGFVVRFLEIFGEEIDEELYNKLEEIEDEFNPLVCDVKFVDYFAVMLGDIQNLVQTEHDYRLFLTYLVSIYKVKGTKKSYQAMLAALGLGVNVVEIPLSAVLYDTEDIDYDDEGIFYDTNCETCSDYELVITGPPIITGDLYKRIIDMVALIEPINAKLSKITYNGDEITGVFIEVYIDANGDLIYNNDADPGLTLTLVNGNLIIDGPNASRYYMDNGDLYYVA